ncbi:PLD nuclease N-terminal domain-containing protein [Pseudomonas quasicaspiana]|uniref:PLD nuclease N-terminal domain-containing protein n=1 Tax=Pseudomonas quasicaspiana TaxID=2829821 RepID=UPI001E3180AF|nr:PLD nuclease N-terminal domain-containing protein [Pseudomonas quasicaspiana]MCD5970936.1 PLDc_N domain-containing protein [Pseudomonas quasicaspiana]
MNMPLLWIIFATILVVIEFLVVMRIVKSEGSRESKCLWILALVFVPVLGLIAWVFAGPKTKTARSETRG